MGAQRPSLQLETGKAPQRSGAFSLFQAEPPGRGGRLKRLVGGPLALLRLEDILGIVRARGDLVALDPGRAGLLPDDLAMGPSHRGSSS